MVDKDLDCKCAYCIGATMLLVLYKDSAEKSSYPLALAADSFAYAANLKLNDFTQVLFGRDWRELSEDEQYSICRRQAEKMIDEGDDDAHFVNNIAKFEQLGSELSNIAIAAVTPVGESEGGFLYYDRILEPNAARAANAHLN